MKKKHLILFLLIQSIAFSSFAESVARLWNNLLLNAIRNDFARPTVHARNLFHISAAMYDAWAVYDPKAETFFLNRQLGGYYFPFDGVSVPEDIAAAQEEAVSYAAYRIIRHRFAASPGSTTTLLAADNLLRSLGYSTDVNSTDYQSDPAAMGNYIAELVIEFGFQDGSNEAEIYASQYYAPVNPPIDPFIPGNPDIVDPNRWQTLKLNSFVDQSGNPIPGNIIPFLGPEWGNVVPFSLKTKDLQIYQRDGHSYKVYHDPGAPAYYNTPDTEQTKSYVWSFSLVSTWSSHLDPADGVMWDISPNSIGNVDFEAIPTELAEYEKFYNLLEGGDASRGYDINPVTGQPYAVQLVPRGDYTRVLAEFWADGPDSETPPGHWFTLLNKVNDHPSLVRKMKGEGEELGELEWDVKSYFMLGGAMHDVAVSVWGIKGWYDYVRPVSAIRYLSGVGQSSNPSLPSYDPDGFKLYEGFIEIVKAGDPLAAGAPANVGKIKVKAWKGPLYITDPNTDKAGVDWILAENWWPYQRPSFVTPPFAGYVSGHSTFSRAAAEVLSLLTGSEYFPGGLAEFVAKKNQFLVFEEGPSVDVILQWARYQDASDQCSLSRIWGGIHPPMDDLRGRIIGKRIGLQTFDFATSFFDGIKTGVHAEATPGAITMFPNPARANESLYFLTHDWMAGSEIRLLNLDGKLLFRKEVGYQDKGGQLALQLPAIPRGIYLVQIASEARNETHKLVVE